MGLFATWERDQILKEMRKQSAVRTGSSVDAELRAWAWKMDEHMKAQEMRIQALENKVAKLQRELRDAGH